MGARGGRGKEEKEEEEQEESKARRPRWANKINRQMGGIRINKRTGKQRKKRKQK